jgi:RHS repeat-associated protein
VVLPDNTTLEYVTDALGRRIAKKVDGIQTQAFIYKDALRIAAELDGSGNIVSQFAYVHGNHSPDFMVKAGAVYRFVKDQLGSPRVIVNVATGAIVQVLEYDEFGRVLADSAPGFQPFGFAGGLYDQHTGLVRFGARDYDAETGRWTAKDPILWAGGQANLYVYVGNDPTNRIDPLGLYTEAIFWEPSGYGDSSFGHTSIIIDGTSYSWGPGGMDVRPAADYLSRNNFRNGRGLILNLTDAQESALAAILRNYPGPYNKTSNNCTDPIERGLGALGNILDDALLPMDMALNLGDLAIGQTAHVRQGSGRGFQAPWSSPSQRAFWEMY